VSINVAYSKRGR